MHSTFFQIGPLHIPVFGVFAAIGLMAALALSQRTARYVGLDPDALWNAGMAAVISAFVISRILLIVFNWQSFLHYPLLVLALPSFTSTGALLTGLFMIAYLRWRKLPFVAFLDAAAPCVALFWWLIGIGRFFSGERDGMPADAGSVARRLFGASVEPVELYTIALAGALCAAVLATFFTRPRRGITAGVALLLAGCGVFFIDFLRLPSLLLAASWLDPVQVLGVAMAIVGGLILSRAVRWSEKKKEFSDAV